MKETTVNYFACKVITGRLKRYPPLSPLSSSPIPYPVFAPTLFKFDPTKFEFYDAFPPTFPEPPAFDKSSLMEPSATDSGPAIFEIKFEIVEDSLKRGRNKLVDSRGYTYSVKRRRGGNTDWQCTVRQKV